MVAYFNPEGHANPTAGYRGVILTDDAAVTLASHDSGFLVSDAQRVTLPLDMDITLPKAQPGMQFGFANTGKVDSLNVFPDVADEIVFPGGLVEATKMTLEGPVSGAPGDEVTLVHLICVEGDKWQVAYGSGRVVLADSNDTYWLNGPFENVAGPTAPITRREGQNSLGSSAYAFAPGVGCEVKAGGILGPELGGIYSAAYISGQRARASWRLPAPFDEAGSTQISELHAWLMTLDDTPLEMTVGDGDPITFLAYRTVMMEIDVVARNLDTVGESRGWKFWAMVITDASGNLSKVGTPTKDPIFTTGGADENAWDVVLGVAPTPDRLLITCTGDVDDRVGWSASLRMTEVASKSLA
jgi:hypothetical protein